MKWQTNKTKPKIDGQKLLCFMSDDALIPIFFVNDFTHGKWGHLPYIYSRYKSFQWTEIDYSGDSK